MKTAEAFLAVHALVLLAALSYAVSAAAEIRVAKPVNAQDVRRYLKAVETIAVGTDAVLDNALTKNSNLGGGMTWLEVFTLELTAERAAVKLAQEDYQGAAVEAATYLAKRQLGATALGAEASRALAVASLGALPIEWGLRAFADASIQRALNYQIKAYALARDMDMSHEEILAKDEGLVVVQFDDSGWFYTVEGMPPTSYKPRNLPTSYKPEQVFGLARQIYAARESAALLQTERSRLRARFWRDLAATESPIALFGTWHWQDTSLLIEIKGTSTGIRIRVVGLGDPSGTEFYGRYSNGTITAIGKGADFYKGELPTYRLGKDGALIYTCGVCDQDGNLIYRSSTPMPDVEYSPPSQEFGSNEDSRGFLSGACTSPSSRVLLRRLGTDAFSA